MEKLRIFFIYAGSLPEYSREPGGWANRALYRSAVMREGLIHLLGVQPAMTDQFAREKQHGDFVAVARLHGGVEINVDHFNGYPMRGRQGSKLAQHLLAKSAPRA
jgi:hypothetical protein